MASTRSNDDDWVLFAVIGGALAAIAAGAWAAWWLAARFSSAPAVPGGPFATVKALKDGDATWPTSATWWAAAMLTVAVAATVAVLLRGPRRHVDRGAKQLPTDPGIRRYTRGTGPTVGRLISGRSTGRRPTLRATIEDQIVVVAGPRTGKTTSIVTPGIVDHRGPVLATSNKRPIRVVGAPLRPALGGPDRFQRSVCVLWSRSAQPGPAAALIAAGVAALVARDTSTATAAAAPAPTTNPAPTTTTSPATTSTSTTSTVPAPVPVELSTGTVTLPYPATKAGTGAFGAIAKPGELVVVPKQDVIAGEPGTATWQWETCIKNDCTPVKRATGDGYRVPADAKAGTTVRAALTITPEGQAGPVTVRSKKVTIVE